MLEEEEKAPIPLLVEVPTKRCVDCRIARYCSKEC